MKPLTEATEEEIRLAKIKAIRNLIGESADQFDLDSMSDENLQVAKSFLKKLIN